MDSNTWVLPKSDNAEPEDSGKPDRMIKPNSSGWSAPAQFRPGNSKVRWHALDRSARWLLLEAAMPSWTDSEKREYHSMLSVLWCSWLGDRKGIWPINTSDSKAIRIAVNVSGWGISQSTCGYKEIWPVLSARVKVKWARGSAHPASTSRRPPTRVRQMKAWWQ